MYARLQSCGDRREQIRWRLRRATAALAQGRAPRRHRRTLPCARGKAQCRRRPDGVWHRGFERIEFGKAPVVAVLHGAVVGGGLEIAAACHIRVAEASAYYALPEG